MTITVIFYNSFIMSKPITKENSVYRISPKVFIINNVTSNFKTLFGKSTTNQNNKSNMNAFVFTNNAQNILSDLPCPYKQETIILPQNSYEVISKDSGSWVLKHAPYIINVTCLKPIKDCCTKTCRVGTKRRSFIRLNQNKQLAKGSYEERLIGEYCKCML